MTRRVVLVTGGRSAVVHRLWRDAMGRQPSQTSVLDFVDRALTGWHGARPIDRLIEGGASGIDAAARRWANAMGIGDEARDRFLADWTAKPGARRALRHDGSAYNPNAGPERNARMLVELVRERDLGAEVAVLGFPGGNGTAGMVRIARDVGVPTWRCAFDDLRWIRQEG